MRGDEDTQPYISKELYKGQRGSLDYVVFMWN